MDVAMSETEVDQLIGVTIRSGTSERAGLDHEGIPDETPKKREVGQRIGEAKKPGP